MSGVLIFSGEGSVCLGLHIQGRSVLGGRDHRQGRAPFLYISWGSGPGAPDLCRHEQPEPEAPPANPLRGYRQTLCEDQD